MKKFFSEEKIVRTFMIVLLVAIVIMEIIYLTRSGYSHHIITTFS